ncbi:hypothetical protein M0R45_015415 [Rubus argutus]|uniref:Uncharacterized protein n=1 Tax=Rubus argutus TaxID=59490 RepID=A0AAW1XQ50_RUBAR
MACTAEARQCEMCGESTTVSPTWLGWTRIYGTAATSIGEHGGAGRQWKLGGGSSLNLIMRNCRFVPWAGIEDE